MALDPKRLRIAALQVHLEPAFCQFIEIQPLHVPTADDKLRFLGPNLATPQYLEQVANMRAAVTAAITRLRD